MLFDLNSINENLFFHLRMISIFSCGWWAMGCKVCRFIGGVWWVAALLNSPPAAAVINVICEGVVRLIAPAVWPLPSSAVIDGIIVIRRLWLLSPTVKFYCIIFYMKTLFSNLQWIKIFRLTLFLLPYLYISY